MTHNCSVFYLLPFLPPKIKQAFRLNYCNFLGETGLHYNEAHQICFRTIKCWDQAKRIPPGIWLISFPMHCIYSLIPIPLPKPFPHAEKPGNTWQPTEDMSDRFFDRCSRHAVDTIFFTWLRSIIKTDSALRIFWLCTDQEKTCSTMRWLETLKFYFRELLLSDNFALQIGRED